MSHPKDPESAGYERTDAEPRPLFLFGVALIALSTFGYLASGWMLRLFEHQAAESAPRPHPLRELRAGPKGPRLQADNTGEYAHYRAEMDRALSEYGWIDPTEEIVRIPVDRALELALERGFPRREDR